MIRLLIDSKTLTVESLRQNLVQAVREFDLSDNDEFALAFEWFGEFDYESLNNFCEALVSYIDLNWNFSDRSVYLLFDRDLAQSVGRLLTLEYDIGRALLVLDCLRFKDFEFVDLGRIRLPSRTVPVTVKSLLFQSHGMM